MKIQESFEVHRAMGDLSWSLHPQFCLKEHKGQRHTHAQRAGIKGAPWSFGTLEEFFNIVVYTNHFLFFLPFVACSLLTHHEIPPPIYSSTTHPNTFSLTISRLLVPFPVIHPCWTQHLTTHDRQLQVMLSQIMI